MRLIIQPDYQSVSQHLYRIAYQFKFALFCKLCHTFHRSTCPCERTEITQITL